MNKYNISPKAKQATQLIMTCIIAGLCLWAAYGIVKVFSPTQSRVPAGSQSVGPAQFMSTIDLQRELNRRYPDLKLKEDGVYGPATQAAHERAIGDQYAKELMVREVK